MPPIRIYGDIYRNPKKSPWMLTATAYWLCPWICPLCLRSNWGQPSCDPWPDPLWAWFLGFWLPWTLSSGLAEFIGQDYLSLYHWLLKAHGLMFYSWHWKLCPNFSWANCIEFCLVVCASIVCRIFQRVLSLYLLHDFTVSFLVWVELQE